MTHNYMETICDAKNATKVNEKVLTLLWVQLATKRNERRLRAYLWEYIGKIWTIMYKVLIV